MNKIITVLSSLLIFANYLFGMDNDSIFERYDFSAVLQGDTIQGEDGAYGNEGFRIEFVFLQVDKSDQNNLYLLRGYDRLKGKVTPFIGKILLDTAIHRKDSSECTGEWFETIWANGKYEIFENREINYSGKFKGNIDFIVETNNNKLSRILPNLYGCDDGVHNFTFNGHWEGYKSGKRNKCVWGEGTLPGYDKLNCGAAEFGPCKEYYNKGWDVYKEVGKLPKRWWKNQ